VGARPIHSQLEAAIADWKGAARALVFPTGFAANLGVLSALADETTTIYSDELNHASIVDGCRLSKGRVVVYPHRDVAALDRLLTHGGRAIVVTDLVFSMDGDLAPIDSLCELCARRSALLVVDEAHAVLGPHPDFGSLETLRVGTLSKTLGALGGFVAGPAELIDLLVNRARPFIFTTAPTPTDSAAALAALEVLRSAEGAELVATLRAHVDVLAPGHPSPIIPVVVGGEEGALEAARRLLDRGFLVPAIRPPSVPDGTSRLRITVSAAHTHTEVRGLADALADIVEVARV
jgi:7-keto-8-aminopelargonate synthetase-like enzyme